MADQYTPFQEEVVDSEYNPFDDITGVLSVGESPLGRDRKAVLLPVSTSSSLEETSEAVKGDTSFLEEEAKGNAISANYEEAVKKFEKSAEENADPLQTVLTLSESIADDAYFGSYIDPATMATVLTTGSELSKRSYLTRFRRVLIAQDIVYEAMDDAKAPWWQDIDFVDDMLTSAIPLANLGTFDKKVGIAERMNELLLNTAVDDDMFVEQFKELVEEGLSLGALTNENRFMLSSVMSMVESGREGLGASSELGWAMLDSTAVIGGVARLGIKATEGVARGAAHLSENGLRLLGVTAKDPEFIEQVIARASIIDDPKTSFADVSGIAYPSALTPEGLRMHYLSSPEATAIRAFEDNSKLLNAIENTHMGEFLDEELFQKFRSESVAEAQKKADEAGLKQVIDFDVSLDPLGNPIYSEVWGTKTGKTFKSITNAEKLASEIGGEVRRQGKDEWVVVLERPAPIAPEGGLTKDGLKLFQTTDPEDLGYGFWARWGSPFSQTSDTLNAILKQGEAARAKLLDTYDADLVRISKTLTRKQQRNVGGMFDDLNSGPDSWRRTAYSENEFVSKYETKYKTKPTESEVAYYLAVQERSDVAWFLKADIEFKDAVNKGKVVWQNGDADVLVIPKERLETVEAVWDVDAKKLVSSDKLPDGANLYAMSDSVYTTPTGEKVQYVAMRSPKTRRIYHDDVMPYNPGGSREYYNNLKFYVKQPKTSTLADGKKVQETPNTVMGVRLEDEALEAVDQLNKIVDEVNIRGGVDNLDTVDFDNLVKRNNRWNPDVVDSRTLLTWADEAGVDLTQKFDYAADGGFLGDDGGATFLPGINSSGTVGDAFRTQAGLRGGRRNKKLVGYGGEPVATAPAIQSIQKSFTTEVARRTEAAYLARSVQGLTKSLIENPKALTKPLDNSLRGLTLRRKVEALGDYINTTSLTGKKLALEREKILARMKTQSVFKDKWDAWLLDRGDALYGRGWNKGADVADFLRSTDPVAAMKGYVFDYWLGAFAWDQYMVQASQVINVAAMSPVHGTIGAAMYGPVRFALANGNEAVIRATGKRISKASGLTEDQFVEMVDMLRESGRTVTGISIAELGADSAMSGGFSRARNKARVFFNEGELVARITAHNAAYREFVKKFPDVSPKSEAGRRFIALKQDKLTQAMTSASRTPFQDAPFAQFLSYQWRMAESIFAGSLGGSKTMLSKGERLRLGAAHLAVYGLAGVPAGGFLFDKLYHKYGVEVPEDYYTPVRYGVLDTILSYLINTDTALSSRLAWGEGFTDLFVRMSDENVVTALGGPSMSFAADGLGHLKNLVYDMTVGSPELMKQDLILMARMFKSGNMAHDAYVAMTIGDYISRNGAKVVKDSMSVYETLAVGMGIPLQEVVNARKIPSYSESKREKKVAKRLDQMQVSWSKAVKDEDYVTAKKFSQQIALMLKSLPPSTRRRVEMQMTKPMKTAIDEAVYWAAMYDLKVQENVGK